MVKPQDHVWGFFMNIEVNNLKYLKTNMEEYYIDENGGFHGEYKAYYSNGQLRLICNYVDNKLQGEYKDYHENGQLYLICNYVNKKLHGEYKTYHENGELCKQVFYNMGKRVDLTIHGMDINNLTDDDINLLMVIYGQQS